jgi:hypothetical protein
MTINPKVTKRMKSRSGNGEPEIVVSGSAKAAVAAGDIRLELIGAERDFIYRVLQEGQITDEARRRLKRKLDLEEASIALNREGGLAPPL